MDVARFERSKVRKQQTFTHNSRNSGLTFVQCYFCQVKNYLILSIEIFTNANLCFLYYLRVAELAMAARAIAAAAPMLTISISAEALAAIEATLPEGREAERRPDGKGGYSTTLPPAMLDPIKEPARPGETAT